MVAFFRVADAMAMAHLSPRDSSSRSVGSRGTEASQRPRRRLYLGGNRDFSHGNSWNLMGFNVWLLGYLVVENPRNPEWDVYIYIMLYITPLKNLDQPLTLLMTGLFVTPLTGVNKQAKLPWKYAYNFRKMGCLITGNILETTVFDGFLDVFVLSKITGAYRWVSPKPVLSQESKAVWETEKSSSQPSTTPCRRCCNLDVWWHFCIALRFCLQSQSCPWNHHQKVDSEARWARACSTGVWKGRTHSIDAPARVPGCTSSQEAIFILAPVRTVVFPHVSCAAFQSEFSGTISIPSKSTDMSPLFRFKKVSKRSKPINPSHMLLSDVFHPFRPTTTPDIVCNLSAQSGTPCFKHLQTIFRTPWSKTLTCPLKRLFQICVSHEGCILLVQNG